MDPRERRQLAVALLRAYHDQGSDDPDALDPLVAGRNAVEALIGVLWLADQILGLYATETASNAEVILQSIGDVEADEDEDEDSGEG
jgi:hypothetical protein